MSEKSTVDVEAIDHPLGKIVVGGRVQILVASSGLFYPKGSIGTVVCIIGVPRIRRTMVFVKLGEGSHDTFSFDDYDVAPVRTSTVADTST